MITDVRAAHDQLDAIKRLFSKMQLRFLTEKEFQRFLAFLANPSRYGSSYGFFSDASPRVHQLDICSYFSEEIVDTLIKLKNSGTHHGSNVKLRLLTPYFRIYGDRDNKNLMNLKALKRIHDNGIELKVMDKLHTRLTIGYFDREQKKENGIVIIGSFDYNKEGLAGSRRDLGLLTENPGIVGSASDYFDELWDDSYYTKSFIERYENDIKKYNI